MIKTSVPFLLFYDNCNQALSYYAEVFGAKIIEKMTFKDVGYEGNQSRMNCIANASFILGERLFYAGDVVEREQAAALGDLNRMTIWLELDTEAAIQELVDTLLAGGSKSLVALEETFWHSKYAKLQDPFGMVWELNVELV